MSKNNEIVTKNAFIELENFNLDETLSEELSGLSGSFERIKIPSAGTTVFEVPGEKPDEPDTVKEFSAVILYHHPLFAYYKEKYTGGNMPPDCGSYDGIIGDGEPGGSCVKCPLNQFGSGENGSKACKNRRRIYLLREGEVFPMLLSLPTGSIKGFTRYMMRLVSKGRKSNSVITRFSLKKVVNSGGISYSQAQFAVDRILTDEELAIIVNLSEQVKSYSYKVGYDKSDDSDEIIDLDTGEVIEPLK